MGNVTSKFCLAAVGAAALLATSLTATAQEGASTYMGGVSTGMNPGCPATEWHIKPVPATGAVAVVGVAYFADMSGISKIEGMRTADGKITGKVTSVSGKGPSGTFTGQRTGAKVHVDMVGPGCSKHTVDINPMAATYGAQPG